MRIDDEVHKMSGRFRTAGLSSTGLPGKIVAILLGVLLLVLVLFFSVVIFGLALCAGLLFGGVRWWKLRALRRAGATSRYRPADGMHAEGRAGGRVIEGEVVRDDAPIDRIGRD